MKKSTALYWSSAILGIVFLALVLVGTYLDAIDSLSILVLFSPTKLGLWFMLGSIVSFTVGIVGIGRQYFMGHRRLFTVLAIFLIPLLIFVSFFFGCVSVVPMAPMFPLRSEITQVTVVDTNPLILSMNVKAITSRDTRIEGALILNSTGGVVAQVPSEEVWAAEFVETGQFFSLAELPGGSEILLALDFNTTLPSGDYLVRLTCWHNDHGSSSFTLP
jgi:hypothetical protein